jgi:SAM-dependent methyltransferase
MNLLHNCRACLADHLHLFLQMGDQPPANMFLRRDQIKDSQPSFSLDAQVCLNCGLIEIADQIPKDFFRHYLYVPSGATTMHRHFHEFAEVLGREAGSDLIVDVGCNDGLLLCACNERGLKTIGIDPAANLAELSRARGVEVYLDYFTPEAAALVRDRYGRAKVVSCTNTLNHIGDLHAFMKALEILLADDGVFIIEVPRAQDLLENNEFDTIYHEHVNEFSLLSIARLAEFFDLIVTDVQRLKVHGGSMRVFLHRQSYTATPTPIVQEVLDEELAAGMLSVGTYDAFEKRVSKIGETLLAMLNDFKSGGAKIAGYGAPAKGNTLLNYFQIGPSHLEFLVDRNPLKHNLFSPGMKIPILGPQAIESENPDILLVLAWNFFEEIREQQSQFLSRGGKFLVPLPEPVLVG